MMDCQVLGTLVDDKQKNIKQVGDDLRFCVMNILPKSQQPTKFISYNSRKWRYFSNSHVTSCWSLDQRVMFGSL